MYCICLYIKLDFRLKTGQSLLFCLRVMKWVLLSKFFQVFLLFFG